MKRICIYVTYDRENIVDGYIGYMIRELKKVVDALAVVCNYREIDKGIENIEPYADRVFYRDNVGFDAGAFKDALCGLVGWDEIRKYDELVLANDSFFGPFVPFEQIFAEMEGRQDDFWGLTIQAETINFNGVRDVHVPEYVQSFFIAVQEKMLHSVPFREYWESLPYFVCFDDAVNLHELKFTGYFSSMGFSYSALADTGHNDSSKKRNNYSQYPLISYELIRKRNFPFLKKQQLAYNTLWMQTQENLRRALDYIDRSMDYDVNLIWDNIIRTMNISDLCHSLHLRYILSGGGEPRADYNGAVIAVSAKHMNACEYALEYLKPLADYVQVRVYAGNEEVFEFYAGHGFECYKGSPDSYRELEKLGSFKYACIIHDLDMSSDEKPSCINKSEFFNVWENLVKNAAFAGQILEKFDSEPKLGFLAPPPPNFGGHFGKFGKGWDGQYGACMEAVHGKKIRCVVSEDRPPYAITENFWTRGEILRGISRLEGTDFRLMRYLWQYLSQEKGFYPGIAESAEYASMNGANMQYYLNEICGFVHLKYGGFTDLTEMKKAMFRAVLEGFCRRYARVYIYGTGYMAERYKDIMPHMEGFIVSDGQPNAGSRDGVPVLYLSDVAVCDDMGVVVCVGEKYRRQIVSQLMAKGINNYICI